MSEQDTETVSKGQGSPADDPTRVAIACQGGGSHTAFTAGMLRTLLDEWDDEYELVGISGTSGGAFNALGTWYGLVTGDAERARAILDGLWTDLAADGVQDRWTNSLVTTLSRMESAGFPLPSISPYQMPGPEVGKQRIREVLERYIDFDAIPDLCDRQVPELVVGTVDINAGVFETFTNEEVTVDAVLASAAVPNLFEAVEIHGHLHWDGLFSQNPPVRDLMWLSTHRGVSKNKLTLYLRAFNSAANSTENQVTKHSNMLSRPLSENQQRASQERS